MQCRCNVFSGRGARVVAVSGRNDGGVADRPLAHLSAAESANVRTFVDAADDSGITIRDGKNIVIVTVIILLYSWENTTEIGADWDGYDDDIVRLWAPDSYSDEQNTRFHVGTTINIIDAI